MTAPLALTIGDPAGVGPELAAAAWALSDAEALPPFFVVGSARVIEEAARQRGLTVPVCT
ncbi:MAG: 4-hydroxythreonine-4-phosphate dehydrogenase, partial [Novosphingobium sp.]